MASKHIASNQTVSLLCFTVIVIGMFIFSPSPVSGEIKTVTHTVKQSFGKSQSPDDARIAAVARAKREALQMAGVYVEGLIAVKNLRIEKDEILALTAGVLKAEVISQKNYVTDNAFGVEVIVKINVDTSVLEDRVKKLLTDRTRLEHLNQARKQEKELLDKIASIEAENRRLTGEKKRTAQLKSQFHEASQGLAAVDWNKKALEFWQDGKYTDSKKAIEYLNEALRLKPDYTNAYYNRGNAYLALEQHQRAIEDYNKALRLKPDDANAYSNRGGAYLVMGNTAHGCSDAKKACSLGNCKVYEFAKKKGALPLTQNLLIRFAF